MKPPRPAPPLRPPARPGSRGVPGFSLVEVMMAAAILVVGFIALIQAVTVSASMLDTAKKQQVAMQIMDGELEGLHAADWSAVANLGDGIAYTMNVDAAGHPGGSTTQFQLANNPALLANAHGFSCTLQSQYLRPASPSAATVTFVKVTCTVTWTGITGQSFSRSTEAYLGKYGLNLSDQKS